MENTNYLCYSLPVFRWSSLHGSFFTPTMSTHYNLLRILGILERQRDPRFINSRMESKCFISWLCGFVASVRVCFCVRGLQTLLSSGLAGTTGRNTGNVSDTGEGDLGLFQPSNTNVASLARGSIEAAACFVSHDLEPPCFFHLVTGQHWSACQCVISSKACAALCKKEAQIFIAKDCERLWQLTAANSLGCLVPCVNEVFVFAEGQLCFYHVLLQEINSP